MMGTAYIHIIMYVYTHAVLCIVCYGHACVVVGTVTLVIMTLVVLKRMSHCHYSSIGSSVNMFLFPTHIVYIITCETFMGMDK